MAEVGRWKPYTQRQGQLLPAFVEDALDAGDPVFFISDVVDTLDLSPLEAPHEMLQSPAMAASGIDGCRAYASGESAGPTGSAAR